MIFSHRIIASSMLVCWTIAIIAGCKDSSSSSTSQPSGAQTGQPNGTAQSPSASSGGKAGDSGKPDDAAIIKALNSASAEPIQQAIAAGMDINAPLRNMPYTPLDYAISKRRIAVAKALIEQGADLSIRDKSGATYLHRAAMMGMPEVVDALLRKGADIAATDRQGQTALHKACIADNLPCVELLTDRQTDMNVKTKEGWTPLQCTENAEVAGYLLAKGADPNITYGDGMTALHHACERNNLEMVRTLVEHKADVNAKNSAGLTPLALAINKKAKPLIVAVLLDHGADVTIQYAKKRTALHLAAQKDELAIIRLLLEKGADVNARDETGQTPLASTVNAEAQNLLIGAGGKE